jgi:hypothetical protein
VLCDETRQERSGKFILLGFMGVTPDVEIAVAGEELRVDRLAFVLQVEPGAIDARISVQIADDSGAVIVYLPERKVGLGDPERGSLLSIQAMGLVFPHHGRYRFLFLVDGLTHFETAFGVKPARPDDTVVADESSA